MCYKLTRKIFENSKGLTTPEKLVLLSIADFAKLNKTEAFPSIALTAWRVEMSERQVQRIVGRLVEKGILIPVKHLKGGRHNPVSYTIDLSTTEQKDQSTRPSFKRQDISLTDNLSDTDEVI